MLIPPNHILPTFIKAPEYNLDILWGMALLFMVLAIIYSMGIFYLRNRIGSQTTRRKQRKIQFTPVISAFVFYQDSQNIEEKKNYLNLKIQIRELMKDNFDRAVLTEILLDLRKDLSGQSQQVIKELYIDLGLHNDAFKKLSSLRWQVVTKGIFELTTMEVKESYGLIIKLINHRQTTIRKLSEIAVVTLGEDGISHFLDKTKYKISEWQQLKLLDILRHKQNFTAPDFSNWLTSHNTHVVFFALRLIKYFKQSNALRSTITLLKHKRRAIRLEAIDCIKDFYFTEALPTLKLIYPKANSEFKIAILDAIGVIGSDSDIAFLTAIHSKESNFNVKGKIVGTLNKIRPESILPTKNIENEQFFKINEQEESTTEVALNLNYGAIEGRLNNPTQQALEIEDRVENNGSTNIMDIEDKVIEFAIYMKGKDIATEEDHQIKQKSVPAGCEPENSSPTSPLPTINHKESKVLGNSSFENGQDKENKTDAEDDGSPNVLKVVINDKRNDAPMVSNNSLDTEFQFTLDNDFGWDEVTCPIETVVNPPFQNEWMEIDWSFAFEDVQHKDESSSRSTQQFSISNDDPCNAFAADFLEDNDLEAMVLLENIREMGDHRELPILQQIATAYSSPLVVELANELMLQFSSSMKGEIALKSCTPTLDGSVFTEIFSLCDAETKLILLEDIRQVGDEKEVKLLQSLVKSEHQRIAKIACEILVEIREKSHKKFKNAVKHTPYEKKVAAKLNLFSEQPLNMIKTEHSSTMFDQLCSISNLLYTSKSR